MISIEDRFNVYVTLMSRYIYIAAITERLLALGRALFQNEYVKTFENRCVCIYNYLSTVTIRELCMIAYQYADMVGAATLILVFYIGIKYYLFKTIVTCVFGLCLYIYVKIMENRGHLDTKIDK